jgi:hypothetical protein
VHAGNIQSPQNIITVAGETIPPSSTLQPTVHEFTGVSLVTKGFSWVITIDYIQGISNTQG